MPGVKHETCTEVNGEYSMILTCPGHSNRRSNSVIAPLMLSERFVDLAHSDIWPPWRGLLGSMPGEQRAVQTLPVILFLVTRIR